MTDFILIELVETIDVWMLSK